MQYVLSIGNAVFQTFQYTEHPLVLTHCFLSANTITIQSPTKEWKSSMVVTIARTTSLTVSGIMQSSLSVTRRARPSQERHLSLRMLPRLPLTDQLLQHLSILPNTTGSRHLELHPMVTWELTSTGSSHMVSENILCSLTCADWK